MLLLETVEQARDAIRHHYRNRADVQNAPLVVGGVRESDLCVMGRGGEFARKGQEDAAVVS